MHKLYSTLLLVLPFFSCAVSVNYLGNSFDKTSHIDVYVDPAAIKRSYTVVGKGYEHANVYWLNTIERLQNKAIQKAKQKGADAILFQDYYLLHPYASVSITTKADTLHKGIFTTSNANAGPVISSGRSILFLRYDY